MDGLVHITEQGGAYYRFDEVHQELRGERTGMRYGIGTKVRVQVSRVDLDGRRVEFRLVNEAGVVAAGSGKGRGDATPSPSAQARLRTIEQADREGKQRNAKNQGERKGVRKGPAPGAKRKSAPRVRKGR